ncbi:hypothetical protein H5T51_02100, partial [Candidatus Bathyarchaeota archaeon]|nr:hypothetical protein [Candidatus Bathyarchaeota archaeon]
MSEDTTEKDIELERIKERKLKEFMRKLREEKNLSSEVLHVTDSNFNDVISRSP